jgi:peptidoglycan/xylan/chitin deacetylase (PgdA/CDA1 family)
MSLLRKFASLAFGLTSLFGPPAALPAAGPPASGKPQIILLKLDDVLVFNWGKGPVSPRWQRITDYLVERKIHASYGIICSSLEKDNPEYFRWIKDLQAQGTIEFWLHGYYDRKAEDKTGEFELGSAAEQRAVLEKSEQLAKAKLGFPLAAFGPHWSNTTDATDEALEQVPDVKIWLYGPKQPKHFSRLSIERVMALEDPTFVPDFDKFRQTYERIAASRDVLVLQGHPDMWDDKRWSGFCAIIDFLRARDCAFMTPSEYARIASSPSPK